MSLAKSTVRDAGAGSLETSGAADTLTAVTNSDAVFSVRLATRSRRKPTFILLERAARLWRVVGKTPGRARRQFTRKFIQTVATDKQLTRAQRSPHPVREDRLSVER